MADDDEVDVLGEFNLDNYLAKSESNIYGSSLVSQNSELLNCDYTIHPQWLLDKPSANPDNWYDTNSSASAIEKIQTEYDTLGHVSTENSITDESGWTEKEKNLLDRGIEIFGKSNMRLAQFIGSKTASEVKYYLKNFYLDGQNVCNNFNEGIFEEVTDTHLVSEVLNDTQIPASIEEVIEAVSTAKPTVQIHKKNRKKSASTSEYGVVNWKNIPKGGSLLKSTYKKKHNLYSLHNRKQDEMRMRMKEHKTRNQVVEKIQKEKIQFNKAEITTGKGLSVPLCEGEEIVVLKNVEEDSDIDIEVDVDSDDEVKNSSSKSVVYKDSNTTNEEIKSCDFEKCHPNIQSCIDVSAVDESTLKELTSLETPKCEFLLDQNNIMGIEKVIHNEFFEGRPLKTPIRYMKIRNHIINIWTSEKPTYMTKTMIRQRLKNCGDVNCIGRIHYFLEQIGAINFGCAQINYVRPLLNIIQSDPVPTDKSAKDVKTEKSILRNRHRNKRKFNNDGEGGCTLTHDETGHVINKTIVNEEPKQRLYLKKPTVRLVYCRSFTETNPQPYRIKLHLSTMLKMDFHAHTSITEVMGLIGGYWLPTEKLLIINHYEPCLNIASSATHCDMCPISQAKAADIIHSKGLDILGWFHSHPTFAPEPSHQDMETQLTLQQWIGHDKPCIGFILSPFNLSGALIASPYRCMVVDKKINFEDQVVPYKFKVDLFGEEFVVKEFLEEVRGMFRKYLEGAEGSRVRLDKPYFQNTNISYLEKYISSVRMHLAKCGTLPKMTCDNIIQGITNICTKNTVC